MGKLKTPTPALNALGLAALMSGPAQTTHIPSSVEWCLVWRRSSDFDDYLYNIGFNYIAFFAQSDGHNFKGATTTTFASDGCSYGASSTTGISTSSRCGSTTSRSTSSESVTFRFCCTASNQGWIANPSATSWAFTCQSCRSRGDASR